MIYKIIFKFITLLIVQICLQLCVYAQDLSSENKNKINSSVKNLRSYVQLRLHDADWSEYSKFITWPDEPSWDCYWVIKNYEIKDPIEKNNRIEIPVVYDIIGRYCYDFSFKSDAKVITTNYKLIDSLTGWKIDAPIPDYPEISAETIINKLNVSAKNIHESSERQKKYSDTAREIACALGGTKTDSR